MRLFRTGKWRTDWAGRLGRGAPLLPREGHAHDVRPTVLVHGVSLGEINATRTLVRELATGDPPARVVVSSTTNTGFDRATQLYSHDHDVVRFPFDFTGAVRRFLDRVAPDVVVLIELEAWPNLLQECGRRGIPVCVVNGRLSDRSFRRYRKIRRLVRGSFERFARVGAQTPTYAERFAALGTPEASISVTDNMKWDTAPMDDAADEAASEGTRLAADLGIERSKPLVVAGSTGPGEEDLLLRGRPDGIQLLVAPRKPERFDEVAALGAGWVRRSTNGSTPSGGGELFLLDTLGELRAAYALADVVVVGRSFNRQGGSDPIEAAALGKAVVMGPHHGNFSEVVDALSERGALRVVDQPWPAVLELLADPEAADHAGRCGQELIRERRGATRRNADLIRSLL